MTNALAAADPGPIEDPSARLESFAMNLADLAPDVVKSAAELEAAAAYLRDVKTLSGQIAEFFRPLKEKALASHKAIVAAEKERLAPLVIAESRVKAAIAVFQRDQEAARRKALRDAEEAARRKAEDDRVEEAARLERLGQAERAKALLDRPVLVNVSGIVPAAPAAPAGISTRELWKAEVFDVAALVSWVMGLPEERLAFVLPNEEALRSFARATKGAVSIPGVRIFSETSVAARRA